MVYIRTKKISNNNYAYLVEIINTKKGPRQKVIQYLGRVYDLELKKDIINQKNNQNNKNEIILSLVLPELLARGFNHKNDKWSFQKLTFNSKELTLTKTIKNKKSKEAIISLNDGYLCTFTLQRIINFKRTKDLQKDAQSLAKYFLEAGLNISQEQFISFYQK
jgi:hypothetical protein